MDEKDTVESVNDEVVLGDDEMTEEEAAYFDKRGEIEEADDGVQAEAETGQTEATEEVEPDTEPDTEPETEESGEDDKRVRTVPHQALHAEREAHKETKQALKELREQQTRTDERLKLLLEATQGQKEAETTPDPDQDIYAYTKHLANQVDELKSGQEAQDGKLQEHTEQTQLMDAYRADAAQFASETPDFEKAYRHLLGSRAQELALTGMTNEAEIRKALRAEEMDLAKSALSNGKSAAENIYRLAELRGYKKAEEPAQEDAEDKQEIKPAEVKEGEKSLSHAGGGDDPTDIDPSMIANMSDEEFDALMSRLGPAKEREVLGA